MTKHFEEAIEQLRDLLEEDQDAAADALFASISSDERQYVLRPEQVAEVRATRGRLRTGATRLAATNEVAPVRTKPYEPMMARFTLEALADIQSHPLLYRAEQSARRLADHQAGPSPLPRTCSQANCQ